MNKQRNIPKSFVGFLIASFLIWLLINLSKESTSVVRYNITYSGLKQNKILQEEPINEIELLVKGTGFKLLSANFSGKKIKILADKLHKQSANSFYLLLGHQKNNIQKQLPSGLLLESVLQDTIHLKLGSLQLKKVPVIPNFNIQYELGYNIAEKITIIPDSILISAPELQLKNINSVSLKKLDLQNVSENIERQLVIELPSKSDKIKASHTKVTVKIKVAKFTEGELEVPVIIKNIEKNKQLDIFPKKVKVVFKVGLKDFNKITAESFKIVCDYQQALKNDVGYLIPELKEKPNNVSSVRIIPNKIDFLVRK